MVGERPIRIMLAVAVVSGVVSAFISNTATTAMMVAIVAGMLLPLKKLEKSELLSQARICNRIISLCCIRCINWWFGNTDRYSTECDWAGFHPRTTRCSYKFFEWCLIGPPVSICLILLSTLLLAMSFPSGVRHIEGMSQLVTNERTQLGSWTTAQRSTAFAFGVTVCLWVTPGLLTLTIGSQHPLCLWFRNHIPEGVAAI